MGSPILETVLAPTCILGEGPIWDGAGNKVIWLDIDRMEVYQYQESTQWFKSVKFNKKVTAIAVKTSGGFIAAVEDGFAEIDLEKGMLKMIVNISETGNRFNDGKCDPGGRFWAGTVACKEYPCSANVYVLNTNKRTEQKINKVSISNGMAWSLDHQIFYYVDTPTRKVVSYAYNRYTNDICHKKTICKIEDGYPDGMTIDADGMLWIAIWNGWKLIRVDPESGQVLTEILLPVSRVTSCVFGGKDLENLYITTASAGLSEQELLEQPLAGRLFVLKNSGYKGVKAFEYNA